MGRSSVQFVIMSMEKQTFTKEEKLHLLKEASEHGVTATLEKHGIYPKYLILD